MPTLTIRYIWLTKLASAGCVFFAYKTGNCHVVTNSLLDLIYIALCKLNSFDILVILIFHSWFKWCTCKKFTNLFQVFCLFLYVWLIYKTSARTKIQNFLFSHFEAAIPNVMTLWHLFNCMLGLFSMLSNTCFTHRFKNYTEIHFNTNSNFKLLGITSFKMTP